MISRAEEPPHNLDQNDTITIVKIPDYSLHKFQSKNFQAGAQIEFGVHFPYLVKRYLYPIILDIMIAI